jgi:hypothetical protein
MHNGATPQDQSAAAKHVRLSVDRSTNTSALNLSDEYHHASSLFSKDSLLVYLAACIATVRLEAMHRCSYTLHQAKRCNLASQQVAFSSCTAAFPNRLPTHGTVAPRRQFRRLPGLESLKRTKTDHHEETYLKRVEGASTRQYSVSSGMRTRSFLFDEPPIRHNQTPIPEGMQKPAPSLARDAVAEKDVRIDRDSVRDPFGKGLLPLGYLQALTHCPHTAEMLASPIRRCAITGAKLPKGSFSNTLHTMPDD